MLTVVLHCCICNYFNCVVHCICDAMCNISVAVRKLMPVHIDFVNIMCFSWVLFCRLRTGLLSRRSKHMSVSTTQLRRSLWLRQGQLVSHCQCTLEWADICHWSSFDCCTMCNGKLPRHRPVHAAPPLGVFFHMLVHMSATLRLRICQLYLHGCTMSAVIACKALCTSAVFAWLHISQLYLAMSICQSHKPPCAETSLCHRSRERADSG